MNQYVLFAIFSLTSMLIFSEEGDTTFIQAHNYVDMDYHGNFDNWAVFPDGSLSYRKILMHYDLRCGSEDAAWPGCSGWDYTTKIMLMKYDDVNQDGDSIFVLDQTLANVITPYGTYMASGQEGFSANWVQRYTYDVTDFAPLLQDSVLLRAFYGGWPQTSAPGCFNVTLNFEMIEGTPPRDVLNIQNLWSGSKSYADLQNLNDSTIFISSLSLIHI